MSDIRRFSSRRQRLDHAFLAQKLAGAKSYRRIAGYFRSSIFELVGEEIASIPKVQVVCNSELDAADVLISKHARETALKERWNEAPAEVEALLHRERYRKLHELLTSGRVEIRVVPKDRVFVHGKAGVIEGADGAKTCFLGSINETRSAFAKNYEILWEDKSPDGVAWVEEEFEALWADAYPLPEAIIEEVKRIADRVEIRFADAKPEDVPAAALAESPIYRGGEQLQPWQRSFVTMFLQHRETYGRARLLLADEVGVGKTLSLAASAMVSALLGDGAVLILCPSTRRRGGMGKQKDEPNNLLDFMLRVGSRAKNVLLGTATPIQTEVHELWDLLRILDSGADFVLGRGPTARWADFERSLPIVKGTEIPAEDRDAWEWLRNPLPPASEDALFATLRLQLGLPDQAFFTDRGFGSLGFLEQQAISQALSPGFLRQHNPIVRHTVLRRRVALEDAGLLQRVGVSIHPNPDAQQGAYAGVEFEGSGLLTNLPCRQERYLPRRRLCFRGARRHQGGGEATRDSLADCHRRGLRRPEPADARHAHQCRSAMESFATGTAAGAHQALRPGPGHGGHAQPRVQPHSGRTGLCRDLAADEGPLRHLRQLARYDRRRLDRERGRA
jgi:hypothetical protein